MRLFSPDASTKSARSRAVYALYELAHTIIDLSAALLFLVGSVLFFYAALQDAGTWCFVVGSLFFAMKPTLRFIREIHLLRIGDYDDLAARLGR